MTRPDVKVEIAFNASYSTPAASRTWTDVTADVEPARGIDINHGRQDERSQADANSCSLTLDNRDGRFSPGLASSPYYPNVKLGRPVRVVVNLCTFGDYGTFEADANDWSGSNATVARTTATAKSGAASLSVTSSAAGDMDARTPSGTSGIPVIASTTYRASAWVRRAAGGTPSLTVDLRVDWYDSGGALISTDTSTSLADTTTFQKLSITLTSPSNASYARVRPRWASATAAGEVHYADDVRLDVDRSTASIDEWPVEWPDTATGWATSAITATSRMARLGLSDKRKSVVEEEILADSPVAYYAMSESEGSTRANDSSGNGAEPLKPAGSGTAVTFGTATGPSTDGLTAAEFATGGGRYLRGDGLANVIAFEFFLLAKTSAAGAFNVLSTVGSGQAMTLTIDASTGVIEMTQSTGVATSAAGVIVVGQTHHIHCRVNSGSCQVYVDGAQVALDPGAVGDFASAAINLADGVDATTGLPGATPGYVVAHFAAYDYLLTADRILAHATAGLTGFSAETAATRLARYAGYAGIPAAEYSFSSLATTPMAHIDTTGKGPVELMQTVATTDGGVLYDGPDGVLTYQARSARYNSTAVLTLDAAAGEVEVGYSPKLDRSALINKMTATLSDGTYSEPAENAASVAEYGAHGPGDLELATTDADEAHAAAWWRVNTFGEPTARAPQLGVELAASSAARQAAILAVKVGDKITVTNLPAQSDASSKSFFVEGWTETITDSQYWITFNVSPATGFEVWEIEHATYGQYDAYPIAY